MDRSRTVARLCALVASLGLGSPAQAHQVQYPKTDVLSVAPHTITLHTEYLIPSAEESGLLYRLFDRDRSGKLDEGERQALREYLCQQAGGFVALELDGHPLHLARTKAELATPGRTDLVGVSLTLVATVALTDGPHTLRLADRHKDRMLAVPLRVLSEGVRVTTALPPLPLLTADQPLTLRFVKTAQTQ